MKITPPVDVALLYGHSGRRKLCKSENRAEARIEQDWHVLVQSTKPGIARLTASCGVNETIGIARGIGARERSISHSTHDSRIEALNQVQPERGPP
jgi:hypothetical protein